MPISHTKKLAVQTTDATSVSRLLASAATEALRLEKSVELIADNQTADIQLVFGNRGTEGLDGPELSITQSLNSFSCTPPSFVAERDSLHGYFRQDGSLVTAHHLRNETEEPLNTVMQTPTRQLSEFATVLQQKHGLRGPWHARTNESGDTLTVYSYADPVTTPLFSALGVNWYALLLFEAQGKPISVLRPTLSDGRLISTGRQIKLQLSFDTVYLDLDDTLIVHGSVCPDVYDFVLHCHRANKPVHLITRHFRKPEITLQHHQIDSTLFSSIIWITDGTPKSNFISADKALFIDDSFQERKEVITYSKAMAFPPELSRFSCT